MFHGVVHGTLFTVGHIGHVYWPLCSHNALGCQLFLSLTRLCPLSDDPILTAKTSVGMRGGGTFSPGILTLPDSSVSEVALVCSIKSSSNVILASLSLQALDNVPVLLYILALKTLLLCLAFAGVKIYQSKKAEQVLKRQQAERRRLAQQTQELIDNLKED